MEEMENLALALLDYTEGFYPTIKERREFFAEHPILTPQEQNVILILAGDFTKHQNDEQDSN